MKIFAIVFGIIASVFVICIIGARTGVHNTPNGTIFCKDKIQRVFHDQSTIITEDNIAFYATKDGNYTTLVELAHKECK